MGCCEMREVAPKEIGKSMHTKRAVLSILRSQEEGVFSYPDQNEIQISKVARLIDIEEPELFVANLTIEEFLISMPWDTVSVDSAMTLKFASERNIGTMISSSISFTKAIPIELILRLLNCPQSRLIWDNSLLDMHISEGSRFLDAKYTLNRKDKTQLHVNRYVREYRGSIVVIQLANEPPEKDVDNWITQCDEFEIIYIWQFKKSTIIEAFMCRKDLLSDFLRNSYRIWTENLYQEVMFQLPK